MLVQVERLHLLRQERSRLGSGCDHHRVEAFHCFNDAMRPQLELHQLDREGELKYLTSSIPSSFAAAGRHVGKEPHFEQVLQT